VRDPSINTDALRTLKIEGLTKVLGSYKTLVRVYFNNGKTYLLWEDKWLEEELKSKYLELFSFAKNTQISV
jgi:hypothetical protein